MHVWATTALTREDVQGVGVHILIRSMHQHTHCTRIPLYPTHHATSLVCRRLPVILGRMTAAHDDDFMALPGMEADSTDTHHARERLSDDATPHSANTSPNASSKPTLDALLDEYRARPKREREEGALFECPMVMDTSGAPWGNGFVKVSHPPVRADSQRRTCCRWVPSYPSTNAQPYCRN
mgnify:CR=1 FL=1